MRTKQEILEQSQRTMLNFPKEGSLMAEHQHLFLEVFIDIRDAIITDAKDALNALIEIRKTH